jgi:hypothetical protein
VITNSTCGGVIQDGSSIQEYEHLEKKSQLLDLGPEGDNNAVATIKEFTLNNVSVS